VPEALDGLAEAITGESRAIPRPGALAGCVVEAALQAQRPPVRDVDSGDNRRLRVGSMLNAPYSALPTDAARTRPAKTNAAPHASRWLREERGQGGNLLSPFSPSDNAANGGSGQYGGAGELVWTIPDDIHVWLNYVMFL
jgi:hypothetical protein